MQSKAETPKAYLDSLPADRKQPMKELRRVLKQNLPQGFSETMAYGMLAYVVPHRLYPKGYHAKPAEPLPFINLASQKAYISLYHMGLYEGPLLDWFRQRWQAVTGSKLDIGKCCVRFRRPEQIPYELIGELAARLRPEQWIEIYESSLVSAARSGRSRPRPGAAE